MFFLIQQKNKKKLKSNKTGFTLIELMVSVSIFSIVLVIAMGAILTVLDANRKARTLTEVMNNLNFSMESITRSIKTGVEPGLTIEDGEPVLAVTAINLESDSFNRELIEYQRRETGDGRGYLQRRVSGGLWFPITSDLLDVRKFTVFVPLINDFDQPRTQISIQGDVRINNKISSSFIIQTTISQRKLNLSGSEIN